MRGEVDAAQLREGAAEEVARYEDLEGGVPPAEEGDVLDDEGVQGVVGAQEALVDLAVGPALAGPGGEGHQPEVEVDHPVLCVGGGVEGNDDLLAGLVDTGHDQRAGLGDVMQGVEAEVGEAPAAVAAAPVEDGRRRALGGAAQEHAVGRGGHDVRAALLERRGGGGGHGKRGEKQQRRQGGPVARTGVVGRNMEVILKDINV